MAYVYILCDDRCEDLVKRVRYVGVTGRTPEKRLHGHIAESNRGLDTYKCRWIRKLLAEGHKPTIEVVECVFYGSPGEKETSWVKYYRNLGCMLTNATDGGEGTSHPSDETRRKMSEAHKNPSDEVRRKIGEASRNRVWSEESRRKLHEIIRNRPRELVEKINNANRGKKRSAESRKRISEANKNKGPVSEETREKMREAQLNRSEEVNKKISESNRGKKRTADFCERMSQMMKARSPEMAKKIAEKNRGQKRTAEARERMSLAGKNRQPISEETREKLRPILDKARKARWDKFRSEKEKQRGE